MSISQVTAFSTRMVSPTVRVWMFLAAFGLLASPAFAQQPDSVWVRYFGEFGNSTGMDIEVVDDGIVVTGTKSHMVDNPPYPQLWLLKVDFDGNLLWSREYGDQRAQKGFAVARSLDGGFIISGSSWIAGIPNAYLVKTDAQGNLEWEHVYPSEGDTYARDVKPTPDGGYVVTGATKRRGLNQRMQIDAFILKVDADGNHQHIRYYGGGWELDETWTIEILSDGYALAGRTCSGSAESRDALILKVNPQGDVLWYDIYGGENRDHIYEMRVLPDGSGFIATGKTESFGYGYYDHGDIWLLRYDEDGNFMWRSVIGLPVPTEFGRSVDIFANGDYIVTGLTMSAANNNQVFVGRAAASDGEWLWTYDFGLPGMDDAWSVRMLPDGDFVIAGLTQSMGPAEQNLLLLRMTDQAD